VAPTKPIPGSNGTQGFQAALNWEHYFNDIAVRGALVYYTDNRRGGARDPEGYNLGLQVGFKGFTVGGNYTTGDNMDHRTTYVDMAKTNIWSAGVSWGAGPWLLGLDYADGVDKLGNLSGDYTSVVTGLRYQFAPGIQVGVGYQHDKTSPLTGNGAHGNAVFVETGLKF
jgi:outer membrane protein OmpU